MFTREILVEINPFVHVHTLTQYQRNNRQKQLQLKTKPYQKKKSKLNAVFLAYIRYNKNMSRNN